MQGIGGINSSRPYRIKNGRFHQFFIPAKNENKTNEAGTLLTADLAPDNLQVIFYPDTKHRTGWRNDKTH
ncbi:hypothetical protein EIL26_22250 [Salmonella enterica subsp. enterica serovar Newport]|nr:hypothetical protein [Salmonella enterica subsp. enterica serovar Newport]